MSSNNFDIHASLVEGCRKGDRASQKEIYQLYAHAMYNSAYRILKNEDDARDILQESFIQMFQQIQSFRGDSSFGAWFKRIVVNKSLNHIRKAKLHYFALDGFENVADEEDNGAPFDYKIEDVKAALLDLPEGYRLVFELYLFDGYTHQEIAEELGVSVATSKSQLSRAKGSLRERLKQKR